MNFTINREVLIQNLSDVSRALSNKVQMPGLTGIKFSVNKNCIVLTTSNNEISIQSTITKDFIVLEEGDFIVQGRLLVEIVKKLTTKDIDFMSFEENTIKILSGKIDFTLNCLQLASFPDIAFKKSNLNVNIDAINLKQIIRKTSFAISTSESRVVLTGLSFSTHENNLEVIATDSFRLARKRIGFAHQFPSINVVIPGKSFDELNKIIDDSEEMVEIFFSSTEVLFKYRNLLFQTRLIDGVFPKIDSLIPNRYLSQIKFKKDELISAFDRASIFVVNESNNVISFTMSSDNTVEIATTSNEIGAIREEINPISVTENCPFQIFFSTKYFIDALKAFDDDEVYINFTGEVKPLTLTSDKDVNLVQLILPVRA